ncbi:MAG TPA: hypothetical protein PK253_14525 [Spirochaetota bacterium]|nr:hypothetical protein [Spirochaetota bacterium]
MKDVIKLYAGIACIVMSIAVIWSGISFLHADQGVMNARHEEKAPSVVGFAVEQTQGMPLYYPVVEYRTKKGDTVRVKATSLIGAGEPREGSGSRHVRDYTEIPGLARIDRIIVNYGHIFIMSTLTILLLLSGVLFVRSYLYSERC